MLSLSECDLLQPTHSTICSFTAVDSLIYIPAPSSELEGCIIDMASTNTVLGFKGTLNDEEVTNLNDEEARGLSLALGLVSNCANDRRYIMAKLQAFHKGASVADLTVSHLQELLGVLEIEFNTRTSKKRLIQMLSDKITQIDTIHEDRYAKWRSEAWRRLPSAPVTGGTESEAVIPTQSGQHESEQGTNTVDMSERSTQEQQVVSII